jgi:hypothetical protein
MKTHQLRGQKLWCSVHINAVDGVCCVYVQRRIHGLVLEAIGLLQYVQQFKANVFTLHVLAVLTRVVFRRLSLRKRHELNDKINTTRPPEDTARGGIYFFWSLNSADSDCLVCTRRMALATRGATDN